MQHNVKGFAILKIQCICLSTLSQLKLHIMVFQQLFSSLRVPQ